MQKTGRDMAAAEQRANDEARAGDSKPCISQTPSLNPTTHRTSDSMLLCLVVRNRLRPGLFTHLRSMPTSSSSSSPSSSSASFSTHPRPAFQHVIEEEGDDQAGEDNNQTDIQEERTALGKALLDPAWMHGRRRIAAPPQEGIERMNDLSRLLSGKQIRLHARRMNRRGSVEEDTALKNKKVSKKKKGGASSEDEDEEGEWDDDGRRNARASKGDDSRDISSPEDDDLDDEDEEGEEDEEEGPIEGEGGKAGYTMLTPSWTGKVASPPEALAYLSTRAVPNFSINLRVLRDVAAAASLPSSASFGEPPRSFLDVGCGPGSGLLAAQTVWPGIHRLEGVDHSGAMRDLSNHLLVGTGGREGGREGPGGGKVAFHRHLPPLLGPVGKTGDKYDVVFASWTLSELGSEASRAMAVAVMWELVADEGGFLVFVEDGSPEGSRLVRSARKFVLDEQLQRQTADAAGRGVALSLERGGGGGGGGGGGASAVGARTVGPCAHDKACPLARNDWCRFSQRVPIGRIQRGAGKQGLGYKDVAFSYVIMQKTGGGGEGGEGGREGGREGRDARLAALHRLRYGDSREEGGKEGGEEGGHGPKVHSSPFPYQPKDSDWEVAVRSCPERGGWGRLIRNPKKKKGHVYLDVCSPQGKLERIIVAKKAAKPLPGKYMAARKAQWGGLWPFPDV